MFHVAVFKMLIFRIGRKIVYIINLIGSLFWFSVSVFGVSANSMQCSYDQRGNSVPTILLMMQKRLYSGGGLQVQPSRLMAWSIYGLITIWFWTIFLYVICIKAEGIFRINAENTEEENVRNHLNKGVVPRGIDVHCLAGLIKVYN